jgi:periplasmic protein TonB
VNLLLRNFLVRPTQGVRGPLSAVRSTAFSLFTNVRPLYPREATKMHIQGTVEIRAVITKAGDLRNVKVLKGDRVLVPAALTAVKKWRYKPCLLNGEAVDVVTVLDIDLNR